LIIIFINIYYIELYRLWENTLQYKLKGSYIGNYTITVVRMGIL